MNIFCGVVSFRISRLYFSRNLLFIILAFLTLSNIIDAQNKETTSIIKSKAVSLDSYWWILVKIEDESTNQAEVKRQPALRQSLKNLQPLPILREQLKVHKQFTQQEFQQLQLGYIPLNSNDNWFIFYEDNNLYFHNARTGYCTYQIELEPLNKNYSIKSVWVNRDPTQHPNTSTNSAIESSLDASVIPSLIDIYLLQKKKVLIPYKTVLKSAKTLPLKPLMEFDFEDDMLGIYQQCVQLIGRFELDANKIKFSRVSTEPTARCKIEGMWDLFDELERKMPRVTRYELQGKILKLFADNNLLLTFERKAKPADTK